MVGKRRENIKIKTPGRVAPGRRVSVVRNLVLVIRTQDSGNKSASSLKI